MGRFPLLFASVWLGACAAGSRPAERAENPAPEGTTASPAASAAKAADADRFSSESAGVSIVKRPAWSFMKLEDELANRKAVSVGNQETDRAMHDNSVPPLVVIARYPEPSEKPNPTLKINLRALGELTGRAPLEIGQFVADFMAKLIASFALEGEVEVVTLSGLPAATFRAHFSLEVPQRGRSYPVKTQVWIVPRGEYAFIIAVSDPTGGAKEFQADFAAMVASIEIRK